MRLLVVTLALMTGCASPDTADSADVSPPRSDPTRATSPSLSPASPPPTRQTSRPGTRIISSDSEYGAMLFDASGQPIYLFTAETGSRPACYDDCAEDWPPVLTTGRPEAAGAVRAGLLGTTRRTDGSVQVTYSGHPLYFYAHEGKFEVLCHDVEEFGGTWLVVQPDGTPAPG